MCSFIKLPSDLLSVLLTDWLSWNEVARCDAAVCNKANRAEWLALFENGCVFSSISFGNQSSFNNVKWVASSSVRIKEINIGSSYIDDASVMESWLQVVGPTVQTLKMARDADFTLQYVERFCHQLTSVATYRYKGEVAWWNVLRANPNLVEVHLWGEKPVTELTTPTDLSLPFLRKLSIDCDTLSHENAVVLLTQLPGLQILQITRTRRVQSGFCLYSCLPDLCPRIVRLDLRYAFDVNHDDDNCFVNLMRCLKQGLQFLVVPSTITLSERDVQSIVQYHGHSLRCLSIPNNVGCDLVDCLNRLTLLHTLKLASECLRYWKRGQINNPSIQHLLIDSCYMHSYDVLDSLQGHCLSLNTLSLCRFEGNNLAPFRRLLLHRRHLDTICVDNNDTIAELKMMVPEIKVQAFISIDLFKID